MRIEEKCNNTHIKPSENAMSYMKCFRDVLLLAKSVGMIIEDSKSIDKFLLSMTPKKDIFK